MAAAEASGRKRPRADGDASLFKALSGGAPGGMRRLEDHFPRARKALSFSAREGPAMPTLRGGCAGGTPAQRAVVAKPIQCFLDLGQRDTRTCKLCGMTFAVGVPQDEEAHRTYCRRVTDYVRFPRSIGAGASIEDVQVAGQAQPLHVLCVSAESPAAVRARVDVLRSRMEEALGSYESGVGTARRTFVGLVGDRAVACVIVERIRKAHRARARGPQAPTQQPTPAAGPDPGSPELRRGTAAPGPHGPEVAADASLSPEPRARAALRCGAAWHHADMGVSQVWVHPDFRRRGVASRLLDTARKHLVYGCTVPTERVAFSQPTEAGWAFAARYTGTERFLIYG